MSGEVEARSAQAEEALERLGLELPPVMAARASYVPVARAGETAYVSGQLAFDAEGRLSQTGRLGAELGVEEGQRCAERCALQLLAQLDAVAGGLGAVAAVLKLQVYVASAPEFAEQHLVADGASDLLCAVLGPGAAHARAAIGVAALPLGSPVELDAVVALRPSA